jgi:hypothetical protein
MTMCTFHRLTRLPPTLAAACLILCGQCSRVEGADQAASGADHATGPAAEPVSGEQAMLRKWIDALAVAESGNRPWIVHQDRDGGSNYGCLQFRERTFRVFVKKFNLAPNAEPDEVMNLIYDCGFQKRLAARMIRKNCENWKHWRKTVERIGLPPGAVCASDPEAADPAAADQPRHLLK